MTPSAHIPTPLAPDFADGPSPIVRMPGRTRVRGSAGYEELTAHQFSDRRDLVVVLLHAPHAAGEFTAFRAVIPVPNGQVVRHYLAELPPGQPVGLVCPDGESSSRLAIRLARLGYSVFHLAGGLMEWYRLQQMGGRQ